MRNIPSTKAIMVNMSVVNGPLKGPRIKFNISISMLLRKSSPVIFLTNSQIGLVQSCGFLSITSISCAIAHNGSLQVPLGGGPFFIQLAVLFSVSHAGPSHFKRSSKRFMALQYGKSHPSKVFFEPRALSTP